ncbi:MAG: hypothetical protein Q9201_002230 [Fulgogasparrea decipioides]
MVTELLANLNPEDTATNIKTLFLSREEVDIHECLEHYVQVAISAMIPDEFEILRWCSSLIRKSADGDHFELSYFTVKEFLLQIGAHDDGEFAAYRVCVGHNGNELAKVCLTYLSFQDFDDGSYAIEEITKRRFEDYPLRRYAVCCWELSAAEYLNDNELFDNEVFSLIKQFLSPSKPSTLISWAQDLIPLCLNEDIRLDQWKLNPGIAEALHY